jgi:hypothetical protein
MSLMDAPEFNARNEKLKNFALVGGLSTVTLLVLLTLAGYMLGHGWLFTNLPAEHKVDRFFNALEAKDYPKAYAIYTNDAEFAQHPEKHADYPLKRFTEDWTTESPVGQPITMHTVDISRTDGSGTFGTGMIVAVRVNGSKKLFMWYQKSDGTLTEPAPHELQY